MHATTHRCRLPRNAQARLVALARMQRCARQMYSDVCSLAGVEPTGVPLQQPQQCARERPSMRLWLTSQVTHRAHAAAPGATLCRTPRATRPRERPMRRTRRKERASPRRRPARCSSGPTTSAASSSTLRESETKSEIKHRVRARNECRAEACHRHAHLTVRRHPASASSSPRRLTGSSRRSRRPPGATPHSGCLSS